MAAHPRLDTAERRTRLAHRHHLAASTRAGSVAAVAASMIGLHSTDPASVYLSARARVGGAGLAEVDRALYDERSIVKHMAMRRTVWAVATDLLPTVQAAASDDVAAAQRRGLARDVARAGIADDGVRWVADVEDAVVATLADLGPTAGRDLSRHVPALRARMPYGSAPNVQSVGVVTRVMTVLSASGHVTRGRSGGAWHDRQPRWVLMRDWCPQALTDTPPSPAGARADLARRWLRAFGPATYDDVKWWTGWTVAHTKAALRDIGAVEVALDGGTLGLVLPDDLEPSPRTEPWVALLPSLDPTTMGWKDRDWYLGPHREVLFDRNGNAGSTVWSDGRIVGGWGQRSGGEVVVRLLDNVDDDVAKRVDDEAGRLTDWMAGVVVRPSFSTPLQRELSG